jgi:DNA-binding winged helix-turn-helix (wHTH) protein
MPGQGLLTVLSLLAGPRGERVQCRHPFFAMRFRFGDFVLDADARELSRSGERIPLSPKAYELLAILVENRPKAFAKAALRDRLWPTTFVVEANLSNLVGEIRVALGEDARHPRFIRTVQGFGYAFEKTIEEPPEPQPAATYRLAWAGGKALLGDGDHVLGRDPDLAVCLDSTTVSRHHARIRIGNGAAILEDLDSKNGTFLNGRRIESPAPLGSADDIRLGSLSLKIRKLGRTAPTETGAQ